MEGRLKGKVALVTGGGAGIGAATAEIFAGEGAFVAVTDLCLDRAKTISAKIGASAIGIRTDVTDEEEMAAAVADTIKSFGRLDCLVNNAGILGAVGSLTEIQRQDWDRTVAVHLTGSFLGMKHAGRVMKAQRRGVILSVASTAGILGGLSTHAYTAAKHALIGLTKSAASEFAGYGVRVNAVAPGGILTDMSLKARSVRGGQADREAARAAMAKHSPLGIAALPEDIAHALAFLASDAARNITGQTLAVDAGQTTMVVQPQGGFNELDARLIE